MESVSTFKTDIEASNIHAESIQLFMDSEFNQVYDWDGEVVKNWMPGNDIYVKVQFSEKFEDEIKPAINWYCSGTHFRGALLDMEHDDVSGKSEITGKIDGELIREKINLKVLMVNEEGFVHTIESKRKIILEGRQSFFPIGIAPFNKEMKNAFVRLDMTIDTDPKELFSIANCRAVFNEDSELFNSENGEPVPVMGTKYFALYEVWRQLIEIALSNENFDEFLEPDSSEDDIRIGVIWSHIIQKIFPGKSLEQIRIMRKQQYWRFCSIIQSEFLKNSSKNLI